LERDDPGIPHVLPANVRPIRRQGALTDPIDDPSATGETTNYRASTADTPKGMKT
jgi:hypothetical protein